MRLSPQRSLLPRGLRMFVSVSVLAAGLSLGACAAEVDLAAVQKVRPTVTGECEEPTERELNPEATMLPGRDCMACHNANGQASRRAWTLAGTVFVDDVDGLHCNTTGRDDRAREGIKVEVLSNETDKVLITLTTNRTGNFFTAEPIDFSSIYVRVSRDNLMNVMPKNTGSADCGSCHFTGGVAGGRVTLK